ncbi:MAG TPA: trypsin-like peptidase domain-containing protein [Acidimicrobiia bacterium]
MSEHDDVGQGDASEPWRRLEPQAPSTPEQDEPAAPAETDEGSTPAPGETPTEPVAPVAPAAATDAASVTPPPDTSEIPVAAPPDAPLSPWAAPVGAAPPAGEASGWAAAGAAASATGTGWGAPPPPSGTWGAPPVSPGPVGGRDRNGGGMKQMLIGALIGAVVAALVSAGVYIGVDNDSSSTPKTTVASARNTSVFATPSDVHAILERVEPAVVAVTTGAAANDVFGQSSGSSGGAGTGVVISSDGFIVTNNHVVSDSGGRIEVTFNDGTHKQATLVGNDASADLAVVKVDANGLTPAALGDSDKLVVGDEVIAIGNALALPGQPSVTRGIVSALNRSIDTEVNTTLDHMIQTDAAINPGNSGGPLVNSDGQVVGINTAIADPSEAQNVGFAIAINQAKPIIEDLRKGKKVEPAFLGVVTQTVTPAIANQLNLKATSGAVVQRVEQGSPADDAGIQQGDVIQKIDAATIKTAQDVGSAVRTHHAGDKVTVVVDRAGTSKTFTVTLGSRPENLG